MPTPSAGDEGEGDADEAFVAVMKARKLAAEEDAEEEDEGAEAGVGMPTRRAFWGEEIPDGVEVEEETVDYDTFM